MTYNIVDNPIPFSGLFVTQTLEEIQDMIESMPAKQRANAYMIFQLTLNSCHWLVEDEIRHQVDLQVSNQVDLQVSNQVRDQVEDQVNNQLRTDVLQLTNL